MGYYLLKEVLKGGDNMDMTSVSTLISTVGFPIAMAMIMFYFLMKEQQSHKEEMSEMTKAIEKTTEAVNNNTSLIQRLLDKLEVKE